jgi:uncharacterized repeat protein (TIGR01451 family)
MGSKRSPRGVSPEDQALFLDAIGGTTPLSGRDRVPVPPKPASPVRVEVLPPTVTLTVNAQNDAAAAVADSYSVNADATLNVAAPGVLTNDTDPEGNTLTAVLVAGPANASAGESIVYTLTLTNAGPSDAPSVSLTDPLPGGTTFVSIAQTSGVTPFTCSHVAGTDTCTAPSFPAGQTAQFALTVRANDAASLSNTATVSAATTDPNPTANNSSTVRTTVVLDVAIPLTTPATAGVMMALLALAAMLALRRL